jgi:oligopeptide transport system substrate-binding protein
MKKSIQSFLYAVIALTVILSGCAPAPTPVPPTQTPSPIPPTFIPEPTETATPIPSPTPLPGSLVLPLDTLGKSIPWLPLDKTGIPGVQYVGFNTLQPPFNSALVRQAFAHAIDRQVLIEMVRKYSAPNGLAPATTFTPPQTLGRDLYGEVGANFDPQRAKELLTRAGYADSSSFPTVTFYVNGAAGDIAPYARLNMATAMADMWKTYLGVEVEIHTFQPYSEYENRLKTAPPDLFWIGWIADYNDPANFIGEIFNPNGDYHGELNYGKFSNSEFDNLIGRAATSNDPAERQALYIQAERILCETEAAVIPIYHYYYNSP